MRQKAFTLIEILIVVVIVGVLAAITVPVAGGAVNKARDAKSMSNLRQWGAGVVSYLVESNQELPFEGDQENPSWAQVGSSANAKAWYNVIPQYVGMPGMKDLTPAQRSSLYRKSQKTILQCPRAQWVGNEGSGNGPRFSYAFNSKIFGDGRTQVFSYQLTDHDGPNMNARVIGASSVPMVLGARASTKEPKLVSGMNNDVGTALAYTRRASGRTGGRVPIAFFDGSVRSFAATELMDNSGRNIATSPVIWNPWNPDEP